MSQTTQMTQGHKDHTRSPILIHSSTTTIGVILVSDQLSLPMSFQFRTSDWTKDAADGIADAIMDSAFGPNSAWASVAFRVDSTPGNESTI
jgi:hypothetical protein